MNGAKETKKEHILSPIHHKSRYKTKIYASKGTSIIIKKKKDIITCQSCHQR